MAWITVDAGTSIIKSVAFADDGRELAIARRRTTVLHPRATFSEQRMDEVWSAVVETISAVRQQVHEPVLGIATTAQGDGAWLVDRHGDPVANAILWNDGRAAQIVEQWHALGIVEQSFRLSGSVTYPGLPNAIFAWLAQNDGNALHGAGWLLTCNAWIHSRLTGRFVADLSDASNPFSDVQQGRYAPRVLALYGLEQHTGLLPPIVTHQTACATLTQETAAQLRLPAGIPVVMAPYDIVSTAYGSGAIHAGQACVILGTTICTESLVDSLDLSQAPSGTTLALDNGLFLRAMPTLTGCEALDWASSLLGAQSLEQLGELAAQAEPGSGNVFFLPYLSEAGERSPFLDPAARGSFHGISLSTSPAHLARAVYEGLCYVIVECLQTATGAVPEEIRACGGGARSDFWCQMIADVIGLKVVRTSDAEVGARGAYLYGLAATGKVHSLAEGAHSFAQAKTEFQPSQSLHSLYSDQYTRFRALRDVAREQWRCLAEER